MENIEAITPIRSIDVGIDKKKKNKLLIKKKLIKKRLTKLDQLFFPTYGADGKINNPENVGKIVDSSL